MNPTSTRCPFVRALALLAAVLAAPLAAPASAQPVAIVDVALVPLDSARTLPHQTVVVDGDRIVAVGPADAVAVPDGARVVDGRGRFLMPGLADMHLHLAFPGSLSSAEDNRATFALLLAHGVTSVRNLWGTPEVLALRDRVEAGELFGPRVWTSGPFVVARPDTLAGPWSPDEVEASGSPYLLARTEADGRAIARYHVAAGYDMVKVHNYTTAAAWRGLTDEGARLGLPVVGHAGWSVGFPTVLTSGRQNTLEHYDAFAPLAQSVDSPARTAEAWYDRWAGAYAHVSRERLALLAELAAASEMWFVPTALVAEWYSGPQPDMVARLTDPEVLRFTSAAQRDRWREYVQGFATNYAGWGIDMSLERAFALALVQALHRAGAKVMIGSDAPATMVPQGTATHDEMALWAEAGVPPLAVLRAATAEPARYLRQSGLASGASGLAVGAPADLVLLRADPLLDVGNARQIDAVVARGRLFDRAALDALLADAERIYAAPAP